MPIINKTARSRFTASRRKKYRRRTRVSKPFYRKVKRVFNSIAEKKYYPYDNTSTVSTTGNMLFLSSIPQGDTDTTRDGDSIYIRSIQINFTVAYADAYNQLRFILFQWLPQTTPTLADILLHPTYPTISVFNHDSRRNYRILKDRRCIVDADDPTCMLKIYSYNKFIRKIQYTGGTTVGNNNIYCLAVSDSNVVNDPSISWSGKINFTDA